MEDKSIGNSSNDRNKCQKCPAVNPSLKSLNSSDPKVRKGANGTVHGWERYRKQI